MKMQQVSLRDCKEGDIVFAIYGTKSFLAVFGSYNMQLLDMTYIASFGDGEDFYPWSCRSTYPDFMVMLDKINYMEHIYKPGKLDVLNYIFTGEHFLPLRITKT